MERPVVIVGAGLAGLACARRLHEAGIPCVVLEAADAVGGRVRSDVVDGFTLDRGFQVLLTAYPELDRVLDVDALDLRAFDAGAVVRVGGRMHRVADPLRHPGWLADTVRAPVGSVLDRVRLARLVLDVRRGDGHALLHGPDRSTLEELEARGFGTMIDRFWRPLMAGVQLDPELEVTARRFLLVVRMLVLGDAAVPSHGMGAIPEQIAGALPEGTVRTGTEVVAVEGTSVRTADDRIDAEAVVVATEGPVAARLLGGIETPPARSVGAVWFVADEPPVHDKAIVLDGDGAGPVKNVAPMSVVAPEYSPDERELVVAAVPSVLGGPGGPGDLVTPVREQLTDWFGAAAADWEVLRVDRIAYGQPDQRPPSTLRRSVRAGDGRYVCGDHRDTPSIQGALFSGRRCAESILADRAG